MPTTAATLLALGLLADAGMIHPAPTDTAAQQRATTWATLLEPDMTDTVLADAVRRIATGATEIYGQVKPTDINKAARAVRADRIKAWRQTHDTPTNSRDGFQQAAYLRGFIRAIGNGHDDVEADRHGRAAQAQAAQVASMEPDTPLPEILARMDRVVGEGRVPWSEALPPGRPVAEIGCRPQRATSTDRGPKKARAALRALADSTHMP